jgi:hypothetical protein
VSEDVSIANSREAKDFGHGALNLEEMGRRGEEGRTKKPGG